MNIVTGEMKIRNKNTYKNSFRSRTVPNILVRNIKYMKYLREKSVELVKQALTYELGKTRQRVTIENSILQSINAIVPFLRQHLTLLDVPERKLKTFLHEIDQQTWITDVNTSSK